MYLSQEFEFSSNTAYNFAIFMPIFLLFVSELVSAFFTIHLIEVKQITKQLSRKFFQSISTFVPACALLMIAFTPKSKEFSTILLVIAVGFLGFHTAGQSINALDLSPRYSSLIYGIGLTFGTIGEKLNIIYIIYYIYYFL
jgi:ACS family sodium-dependent inorganic phosphate cotransporter